MDTVVDQFTATKWQDRDRIAYLGDGSIHTDKIAGIWNSIVSGKVRKVESYDRGLEKKERKELEGDIPVS